jgi:cytochrome b561
MKRAIKNYALFIALLLLSLFEALSGFVLWFALPEGDGYQGGRQIVPAAKATFLWERHTWIELHNWVSVALIVVVLIHIILHWKWIVFMTRKILRGES